MSLAAGQRVGETGGAGGGAEVGETGGDGGVALLSVVLVAWPESKGRAKRVALVAFPESDSSADCGWVGAVVWGDARGGRAAVTGVGGLGRRAADGVLATAGRPAGRKGLE